MGISAAELSLKNGECGTGVARVYPLKALFLVALFKLGLHFLGKQPNLVVLCQS